MACVHMRSRLVACADTAKRMQLSADPRDKLQGLGQSQSHERRGPGGVRYAGVFPSLTAGVYTLWSQDGRSVSSATVVGGEVTQVDWVW